MEIKLTELVDKIIGKYSYYGETNADCKSLKNLDEVEDLFLHILTRLAENAKQRNSYMASVSDVGEKSHQILQYAIEVINEAGIAVGQ